MFYYLLTPYLTYHFILIAAAVIPAIFLMLRVWRADRLEPEPPRLMLNLVTAGVISALIALCSERILSFVLDSAGAHGAIRNSTVSMTALSMRCSCRLASPFGKTSATCCTSASKRRWCAR